MIERVYFTQKQAAKEAGITIDIISKMLSKLRKSHKKTFHGWNLTKKEVELIKEIRAKTH
jgi:hypothetical protein